MMRRPLLAATAVLVVLALIGVAAVTVVLLRGDGPNGGDGGPGSTSGSEPGPLVRTAAGRLEGFDNDGIEAFRGIPYAAPPVDGRRWKPPAPAAPWSGVRSARSFGPSCLQPEPYEYGAAALTVNPDSSEDCLYLNVNRPADDTSELPVIVWLHGGGFLKGSGASSPANTPGLVERGLVVVTVNYRLGQLGFFAHPSLPGRVANFGLLDQIAALRWVRDNITKFGGDPGRVTIMGASAGGMSVNALMSSPAARGLFSAAISQSGLGDEHPHTLSEARRQGAEEFPRLSAAQLRRLPGDRLLSSTFDVVVGGDAPIIDDVLPMRAADTFAAGEEADVPLLIGTSDGEFSDHSFAGSGLDPDAVRQALGGRRHRALVAAYGPGVYHRRVLDDAVFMAPALRLAAAHARRAPTYRYRFAAAESRSGHGSEMPYVFDAPGPGVDPTLAAQIADYWAAFAIDRRPDPHGLPAWPQARGSALMEFTRTGPLPLTEDPWTPRLKSLVAALGVPRASS